MDNTEQMTHARTLRAEILASPDVWLPRRDTFIQWLDAFLRRAEAPKYELGDTESADLDALDVFLRRESVPAV